MAIEFFMTKFPRKNVPDVGIELGAACMPSGDASDRPVFGVFHNVSIYAT